MKFHKPSTAKKGKFKEYLFLNVCAKERGKTVLIKEIKNIAQIKTHSLLYFVRKKFTLPYVMYYFLFVLREN